MLCSEAAFLVTERWPSSDQTVSTLGYAAMFLCGIVLATHIEPVQEWFRRRSRAVVFLIGLVSLVLYTEGHKLGVTPPTGARGHIPLPLPIWLITLGAIGYMLLALCSPPMRRLLKTRPALFLGRISYSLYLVHGTVLFALTHLLRGRMPLLAQLLIYLALSLLLGFAFCVGIEEPFLHLSRWAGRRLSASVKTSVVS